MKLSEALTKYIAFGQYKNKASSLATYQMQIKHLVLYFHNCQIEDILLQDIVDYLEAMRELGWDMNSLSAKSSAYKQFFKFFQTQGVIKFDAQAIPVPQSQQHFPKLIDEADYKKLLKVIERKGIRSLRSRLLLGLLWDTGIRLGELRSLDVESLDLKEMRTIIRTEKSRGIKPTRMVFWTKETNEILREYLELRSKYLEETGKPDEGALFINVWNRWGSSGRWSETGIEMVMQQLSYKANLGYIANPHRFRHRFGRNLALQGANNSVISDMMGHANIESTRIYTVMNESMMQETYNKFFKKD